MKTQLFNFTFTPEQVNFVMSLFEVGAATSFSALSVGQKFFVPGTKSLNRFWRSGKNGHRGYMSPIVCRKDSEDTLTELMTDFPVVEGNVPPDALDLMVYPVRFLG